MSCLARSSAAGTIHQSIRRFSSSAKFHKERPSGTRGPVLGGRARVIRESANQAQNSWNLPESSTFRPSAAHKSSPLPASLLSSVISKKEARISRLNQNRRSLSKLEYGTPSSLTRSESSRLFGPISADFRRAQNVEEIDAKLAALNDSFTIDAGHYCCAVRKAASLGSFRDAWRLLNTGMAAMSASERPGNCAPIAPTTSLFSVGLWLCYLHCEKRAYFDKALDLLKDMEEVYQLRPGVTECATLLKICLRTEHYARGLQLFWHMTKSEKSRKFASHEIAESVEIRNLVMRLQYLKNPSDIEQQIVPFYRQLCCDDDGGSADSDGDGEVSTEFDADTYASLIWIFMDDLKRRLNQGTMTPRFAKTAAGKQRMREAVEARECDATERRSERVDVPLIKGSAEWRQMIDTRHEQINAVLARFLDNTADDEWYDDMTGDSEDVARRRAMDGDLQRVFGVFVNGKAEIGDVWTCVECLQRFIRQRDEDPSAAKPTAEMYGAVLKALTRFADMTDYWQSAVPYTPYDRDSGEGGVWPLLDWLLADMVAQGLPMDAVMYGMLFHLCSDELSSEACGRQPCNMDRLCAFYVAMLRQANLLDSVTRPLPKGMRVAMAEGKTPAPLQSGRVVVVADELMRSFLQTALRCMHHGKWQHADRLHLLQWFIAEMQRMNLSPSSMTAKLLNKHFDKYSNYVCADPAALQRQQDPAGAFESDTVRTEDKLKAKRKRLSSKNSSGLS